MVLIFTYFVSYVFFASFLGQDSDCCSSFTWNTVLVKLTVCCGVGVGKIFWRRLNMGQLHYGRDSKLSTELTTKFKTNGDINLLA